MLKRRWTKRFTCFNNAQKNVVKVMTNVEVSKKKKILEVDNTLFKYRFPVLLWLDNKEENDIVRSYIRYLIFLLVVQTIAILCNVLLVWDPRNPDVWVANWQTITSKSIISATCVMLTILTYCLRKIDQKQLPAVERRTDFLLVLELIFLMIHIPPITLGCFGAENDVWNVMGTAKLYLLAEILKVNHPFWIRRYEINAARNEERSLSYLVGTMFCFSQTLTKLDPIFIFISFLMLLLGMFTTWIYIVERSQKRFDIWIMLDHVLSTFFSVPPADHGALQTLTGRNIKMLVGLFSMFYAAVVGWTFGFRVAENKQFLEDMLNDLNANLKLQEKNATIIQRWWREVSKAKKNNKVLKKKRVRPGVVWRLVERIDGLPDVNILDNLRSARRELSEVGVTNCELKKSNERLTRSHQEMINLALVLVSAREY